MPSNIVARLANKIRRKYPHLKFRIRRAVLKDAFATAHLHAETGTYIITIDRDIKADLAAFLLVHEAAHCLSFLVDSAEHGPAFWAAYQGTYAIYEDFTGNSDED
jgi:predicted metal-dependent hydrolase